MHDIVASLGEKIKPDDSLAVKLEDVLTSMTDALINVKSHMDETSIEIAKNTWKKNQDHLIRLPFIQFPT